MAILEVLSRSQRLCEKRSVVILMYPSYLKDCVEPGAKITLYHGSQEKNLHELLPANDYAVRHGFAKRQSAQLTPLLFLATNALTAATYAIPETLRASVRSGSLGPRGEHRRGRRGAEEGEEVESVTLRDGAAHGCHVLCFETPSRTCRDASGKNSSLGAGGVAGTP